MLRGGVEAKHLLPATEAAVGVGATRPVHHHHGDGRCLPLFPPSLSIPSAPKLTPSRLPTSSRCTRCGCPPASSLPSDLSSFLGPTHLIPTNPLLLENLRVAQGSSHLCACFPSAGRPGGRPPPVCRYRTDRKGRAGRWQPGRAAQGTWGPSGAWRRGGRGWG